MRLYRENLALKVQLDALAAETTRLRGKRARVSLRTRAAQVWAYLVTRGNRPFQKHNLSASSRTIKRWATKLRQGPWQRSAPRKRGGRPPTRAEIVEMVLTLKRENSGYVKQPYMWNWSHPERHAPRSRVPALHICSGGFPFSRCR